MTNEVLKTLETRRSCRAFRPDMITEEELQAVLRAGTYAPTGMGTQSATIIAVTNKEMRDAIAEENRRIGGWKEGFDPFYGAPVILIVLGNRDAYGDAAYDGALVMGNLLNAAASIGLGSIWIHRARQEFESPFGKEILDKLGLKGNFIGVGHCALGYPAKEPAPPAKRKEDYVYYIR